MLRLQGLRHDLRYGFRTLLKSPGFTGIALTTLVLGIGATTAIFSVVNAVLLRPLPYKEGNRLVHVIADDPRDSRSGVSYATFEAWRSENRSFEDIAIYYRNSGWSRVAIGGTVEPESVQAGFTSADFFRVMGVPPVLGRAFDENEEKRRAPVAVLSDAVWARRYNKDRGALGKLIEVDGRAFTIIGVMPPQFQFPARETQLWLPITTNRYWLDRPQRDNSHSRGYYMRWNVVARLQPGVTSEMALADLKIINGRSARQVSDWNMGLGTKVVPLSVEVTGSARLTLLVLLGSVSMVLLIACGNVANLMLARGASRLRELSIRTALGATQGRIVRQVLTESVLLVSISAALAIVLATVAIQMLIHFGPADLPRLEETRMDGAVLCFTLGVSLIAAVLFGLVPALRAGQTDPNCALKSGGRTSTAGSSRVATGGLLVVGEFALAVVLLTGAGLLIRSFYDVKTVDLGFRTEQVLTMRVRLPDATPVSRKIAFQEQLLNRLRSIPGLHFVGGISGLFEPERPPLNSLRAVQGRALQQDTSRPLTWTTVSGDYFQAMGIPVLQGRYFSESDTANSPPVAIIDESMARRYWPNENPVGQHFKGQDARGRNDDWLTVVGVVKDTRRQGLEQQATPHAYEWWRQTGPTADWVIQTSGEPDRFSSLVRSAVRETEPFAVTTGLMSMEKQIELQTSVRGFQTWLLGLFAALALLLSAVGIYGVISYTTAQRTQEIGLRMAMGARTGNILSMILRQGLALVGIGLIIGLAAATVLTRLLSGLLFGVTPTDPITFATVASLLLGIATLATLVPALRAIHIDPMTALRAE